ncbi:MAG: DUF2971 domain-containing protein [Colwellia sp.]|uniref:DUF2971 domain-containing protein n=1 Tax=Colwellia sp. TaxID=56799 RepID=UPI0025B989F8|nr:DUF2971 domain-containing protein [Colwellia sp.]NQZ28110.1 DUF2971 domain-containing protein [Colwellia sp.]
MSFSYTVKYPIKVQILNNEYTFSCIDYPQCEVESVDFHKGLNSIQNVVENLICKISQENKYITPPSSLKQVKDTSCDAALYCEVEVQKYYSAVPETLYYYLPISEILFKMLINPYIWFSDPKEFNDPFELPDVFERQWTPKEEWDDFVFVYNQQTKLDIFKKYQTSQEAYIDIKANSEALMQKILSFKLECLSETISKARVACFSRYYDNILMWSHYSKKHTGIVIGYDYACIVTEKSGIFGGDVDYKVHQDKIRAGSYSGDIKNVASKEFITRSLLTKHPSWSYEQEYRLINSEDSNGRYSISKGSIKEVYFGCEIDPDIKKSILALLVNDKIDFYEMNKSHDINLDRIKI